jgi:hypothetical protein
VDDGTLTPPVSWPDRQPFPLAPEQCSSHAFLAACLAADELVASQGPSAGTAEGGGATGDGGGAPPTDATRCLWMDAQATKCVPVFSCACMHPMSLTLA